MTRDLTSGSPMKLVLSFTGPLIFGFLFQQLYNLVDTLIVGQFLGTGALASVGATGSLNFLILGFLIGICSGFAIPIAQCYGAHDLKMLRRYFINGAILATALALMVTLATCLLLDPILRWMKTPEDIFSGAYSYMLIILLGIPATVLYNYLSSVIRALGDSRTPVIFLTIASFLNILLDLLFILVIPMGVAGAALATVISQAVSGLLCLFQIVKRIEILQFVKSDWYHEPPAMKKLLSIGVPMGLQYSITAVGTVILQASVNAIGSGAVASITAASKISCFLACIFDALANTAATYTGQNVGAGKLERIGQGLRADSVLGIAYAAVALVLTYFFGRPLICLFVTSGDVRIIEDAYLFLLLNVAFYIPLLYVNLLRLTIQGAGYTSFAVFAGVFELIARCVVALAFVPVFGFTAACFASPAAWILADAFLFPAYRHVFKKLRQLFAPAA